MQDPATCCLYIGAIAFAGLIIGAAEHVARMSSFDDDSFLSWRIGRTQGAWAWRGKRGRITDVVFSFSFFRVLLVARLVAAIAALVLVFVVGLHPIPLAILVITSLAINMRSAFGLDGAHQMNVIVLVALLIASISDPGGTTIELCLWFIAAQAILSYSVAGFWKLRSSVWRSGSALVGILSTNIYGLPAASKLLAKRPLLNLLMNWSVIAFECSFFLVLVPLPSWVAYGLLSIGALFHLGTAVLMGLNGFLFAFVATYPAILFARGEIGRWLGG